MNDAPALAAADCGISVASAHSAAAQTADVVIDHGGIKQVLTAIELARQTASIARQNLGLALVYNLIAIPFAVSGALPPAMAALAMLVSSLSVGLNSLRLSRSRAQTLPILAAAISEEAQNAGEVGGRDDPSGAHGVCCRCHK